MNAIIIATSQIEVAGILEMLADTHGSFVLLAPWFAFVATLSGWIVTHLLTLRAQRLNFVAQISNTARMDIAGRIRQFQLWCAEANARIGGIPLDLELGLYEGPRRPRWQFENRQLLVSDSRTFDWLQGLEEYEILFPRFVEGRIQLLKRQRGLNEGLSNFCVLAEHIPSDIGALRVRADELHQIVIDQVALSEDLRNHLQNAVLAQITGHAVPKRIPEQFHHLQLLEDKEGLYKVFGDEKLAETRQSSDGELGEHSRAG
jgi:hypothetical protein